MCQLFCPATRRSLLSSATRVYPLYMTIGNIPKEIRCKPSSRAHILLGYLPTSRLSHIKSPATHQRALSNLFCACVGCILAPLKKYGLTGINMTAGDGSEYRNHPLFAVFIGDYPKQVLVGRTKTGDCPTCPASRNELQDFPSNYADEFKDLQAILNALKSIDHVRF